MSGAVPGQAAPAVPDPGCTVCASGVTSPHGADAVTAGQAHGKPSRWEGTMAEFDAEVRRRWIEASEQLGLDHGMPNAAAALAAQEPHAADRLATVDLHRWYAVINQPDGTSKVIGHTDDGLGYYNSVDEWEAKNS